jgi:chromosome segregation ATPase
MLRLSNLWAGVQQRLAETASPLQNQQIQQEFAIIRRAILRLRDSTDANMATLRASLSQEIESLQLLLAQPAGSQGDRETAPEALAPAPETQMSVRLEISELHQRIEQLEQKYREIVKPYLKRLVSDVKHLQEQSDTAPVQAALASLRAQVENLVTEVDAQLQPQQVQGFRSAAAMLSESIPDRQRCCEIAAVPVKSVEG